MQRSMLAATTTFAILAATPGATGATAPAPAAARPTSSTFESIPCESDASNEDPFYHGKSASKTYDKHFKESHPVPRRELNTHIPQGLTTWSDWDGGRDLLLAGAHRPRRDAHLIGIDAQTGAHVGTVRVAKTHAGGVAVTRRFAFVTATRKGAGGRTESVLRRYRLDALRAALKDNDNKLLAHEAEIAVHGHGFLGNVGDTIYAGNFHKTQRTSMMEYEVQTDGTLKAKGSPREVPARTQGVLVSGARFIFSSSFGRTRTSDIHVVKGPWTDLDSAKIYCFRAPTLSEGITAYGDSAYLLFESGSYMFRSPRTRNVITKLHRAPVFPLIDLVD